MFGSLLVSTQALPQVVCDPQAGLQAPAWQVVPAGQGAAVHAASAVASGAQWLESLSVSTQPSVPPQSVKPALQVDLQRPPWHDCPAAHAVPQAPQLLGSV